MKNKDALIQPDRGQQATAIRLVCKSSFDEWLKTLNQGQRASVKAQKFKGEMGQTAIVPDGDKWFAAGGVADVTNLSHWCLANLAETLPEGDYRLENASAGQSTLGWQTAQYKFERYKKIDKVSEGPRVLLSKQVGQIERTLAEAEAENLVRDLVNTPAEDMGPSNLESECEKIAKEFNAQIRIVQGDTLEEEYPLIYAVGKAAARHHAPRLIRLTWGEEKNPGLGIVGKGVCFDSGGLDIKSANAMKLMKKDMGGAAHAIALAQLIMKAGLPVRLHLLVPAVENAISSNAFRPGDILKSRKGLTVEIGNTDAEGRLILADALTCVSEEKPDLIIDFATLTGAARVALGPDLPALMTRHDDTANALIAAGIASNDEIWRLPLPGSYRDWLNSDVADVNNIASNTFAGASVAGLFLNEFVDPDIDWAHFDTFAWRPNAKPGRPAGGAALGLRASYHMLLSRYTKN
jgi:leucyl aminopeptidase